MRTLVSIICITVFAVSPLIAMSETVDGRVIQVELPAEDVTLLYVEARSGFTVKLEAKTASVEGQKMFIGDGQVALDLVAHASQGIFLQGVKYKQGDRFKIGAKIKVQPGYKKASELEPGDVYVRLPGVLFALPGK